MVKNYETTKEAAPRRSIGGLRIARVSYEHMPIESGGKQTIGQMIDEQLARIAQAGDRVNEISLFFETIEQQEELARIYS